MNPTTEHALVELENISLRVNGRTLLDKVSLTASPKSVLSVIGPNGAGKTCLIKIMLGLIEPTSGQIKRKPQLRIGYMPQRLHVDPIFPITVKSFLQMGQPNLDLTQTLKEVGVQHVLQSPLQAISGGELQRVLLARALLRKPDLLVLDEPAQGVDLVGQSEVYDLIAKIRDRYGCGIVMVSHDLNVVMAQTDTVICLNQHVCCHGTPEKVSRDPAFTALFGPIANSLAFYTHRHDHQHDVDGGVKCKDKDHPHD
jgi:zinc transport system ATP-binding protein